MATDKPAPETHTLEAPGAVIHYDVRSNPHSTKPLLLMIGSPMGADGFENLANYFTDRTVVTYDPRGAERSKRTDSASRTTTEEHADDIHRVIMALGARSPVDIFASSGGAVNGLALVSKHPEQVRVLVAHEPPAFQGLPDRDEALAACDKIRETYLAKGFGPAMAIFIRLLMHRGSLLAGFARQDGPDPAKFGLPVEDDGARDSALLGLNMPSTPAYKLDYDALLATPVRVVIGVGTMSAEMIAGRAAVTVAARLGKEPVMFPGGHNGFGKGPDGKLEEFAVTLRRVLDA